jgi:hypothetical protein
VQDNFAAADDSLDPKDSAAQLGAAGRVSGYSLVYDDLSMRSFTRGSGVIEVASAVDLFRSANAADAYIAKRVADGRKLTGRYLDDGELLEASGTFPVAAIGDRAVGLRERARLGHGRFATTVVMLRVGSLIGTVAITRADTQSAERPVVALARSLEQRIRRVETVALTAPPVAVPPIARPGVAPQGGPALEPMVLRARDVAAGARVSRQGYVADRNALATYERELAFDSARVGGSILASVETDASLLRSVTEARGQMNLFRSFFDSAGLEATLKAEVSSARVIRRSRPAAGDEAYVAIVSAPFKGRPVHVGIATVRVGPVLGQLLAFFTGPAPQTGTVEAMTRTFAQRIAAGL